MVYSEKRMEQVLTKKVRKLEGIAVKFVSPGFNGVPDRLVLFPGGKLTFVELKAPGKKMQPLQVKRKIQLEALGFLVYCIDSLDGIEVMLSEVCAT